MVQLLLAVMLPPVKVMPVLVPVAATLLPGQVVVGVPLIFKPYTALPTPSIGSSVNVVSVIAPGLALVRVMVRLAACPAPTVAGENSLLTRNGAVTISDAVALPAVNPRVLPNWVVPLMVL